MSEGAASAQPTRRRRSRLSVGKRLVFALLTVSVLLGVTEGFLRVREVVRASRRTTLSPRQPDTYRQQVLVPDTEFKVATPEGLTHEASINGYGMRAPPVGPKPPGTRRVLCVGGSTTYGLFTSANHKTWPAQVERLLREAGKQVEVLNGGVPAWDVRTSQTNLELRLYELQPDVVICYHAYNDLVANLDPRYARDSQVEDVGELWQPLRASALYRFLRRRLQNPREQLQTKATQLSAEGVAAYERNLRRFVRRTREEGAKPFLCTYPSAFRETLEASRAAGVPGLRRWFEELSPFEYPTLMEGLRRYNDTIRAVGQSEGVPCAELERGMPHDVTLYASTVHHTDEGEVEVAKIVAKALLESGVLD